MWQIFHCSLLVKKVVDVTPRRHHWLKRLELEGGSQRYNWHRQQPTRWALETRKSPFLARISSKHFTASHEYVWPAPKTVRDWGAPQVPLAAPAPAWLARRCRPQCWLLLLLLLQPLLRRPCAACASAFYYSNHCASLVHDGRASLPRPAGFNVRSCLSLLQLQLNTNKNRKINTKYRSDQVLQLQLQLNTNIKTEN